MTLNFNNAWILYFLWVVPLIAIWWFALCKRSAAAKAAFISPELQKKLFPKERLNRQLWQSVLASIAILLLLVAAAGPRWGESEQTVLKQARDIVIAVDVSRSMLANDVHPSRLGRAKIDLVDLIKDLQGDRAALVAFRSKAKLVCPLTTDYAFLRQALDGLSPNSAPRGETNIGAGITKALDSFDEKDASHKAIILISDGEDLTGKSKKLAELAGKRHIPIYTVGIGSRKGSRIPDSKRKLRYLQHKNKDIVTKLNNDTLYAIAKASGGSYIPVETANMTSTTLGTIYRNHLRKINARELAETHEIRAIERYQWFLFPAIILLFATAALSRGRLALTKQTNKQTNEMMKKSAPLIALIIIGQISLFAPNTSYAQSTTNQPPLDNNQGSNATNVDEKISTNKSTSEKPTKVGRIGARAAQKLFKKGKYAEAAEAYLQSSKGATHNTERIFKHNAAVALAKEGKFKEAAEILRELSLQTRTGDKDENAALGATLYHASSKLNEKDAEQATEKARLLSEAGEAFKEAWHNNNGNTASKDDLALTISQLKSAKEQAKVLRLTKQYKKTPAPQLADQMLKEQRLISQLLPAAITNTTPARIRQLEALSERQRELSDLWIPLNSKMQQAIAKAQKQGTVTNAQHLAALTELMKQTQEEMGNGADLLRDLNSEGFRSSKISEHGIYQLWKTIASYGMLLNEDISQQTNTITMTDGSTPADEYTNPTQTQTEAAQLTQMFKERFEQAVPPKGNLQQQQPAATATPAPQTTVGPTIQNAKTLENGTNAPPQGISAEDRAMIVKLTDETIGQQKKSIEFLKNGQTPESLVAQKISHKNLLKIKNLLPKQKNKQQQQNQKKQQQQQKKQNQNQQKKQKKQQQQQKQNQQKQQKQQKKKQKKQKPKESKEQKDISKLLKKALERERKHEEEKQKRINDIPLPAFERDW